MDAAAASPNLAVGAGQIPSPVVCDLIVKMLPRDIHAYDVLRGLARSVNPSFVTDCPDPVLDIPNMPEKMFEACRILDRALGVGPLPTDAICRQTNLVLQHMSELGGQGSRQCEEFEFFVAGGFAVSQILGYAPWGDIDVCFQPQRVRNEGWWAVWGASWYPTNILLTSDARDRIRSFDLDICRCALRCVVSRTGERRYTFVLTQACAQAFMNKCALLARPHPACECPRASRRRAVKYRVRGLAIPSYRSFQHTNGDEARAAARLLGVSLADAGLREASEAGWIITVIDGRVETVEFRMMTTALMAEVSDSGRKPVYSEPCLLYPCVYQARLASVLENCTASLPWILRVLRGPERVVCLPEAGRVRSNCFAPSWLIEQMHGSMDAAVELLRAQVPQCSPDVAQSSAPLLHNVIDEDDASSMESMQESWSDTAPSQRIIQKFVILISLPVRPFRCCIDWRPCRPHAATYGPEGALFVETASLSRIRGILFCAQSGDVFDRLGAHREPQGVRCCRWECSHAVRQEDLELDF